MSDQLLNIITLPGMPKDKVYAVPRIVLHLLTVDPKAALDWVRRNPKQCAVLEIGGEK